MDALNQNKQDCLSEFSMDCAQHLTMPPSSQMQRCAPHPLRLRLCPIRSRQLRLGSCSRMRPAAASCPAPAARQVTSTLC